MFVYKCVILSLSLRSSCSRNTFFPPQNNNFVVRKKMPGLFPTSKLGINDLVLLRLSLLSMGMSRHGDAQPIPFPFPWKFNRIRFRINIPWHSHDTWYKLNNNLRSKKSYLTTTYNCKLEIVLLISFNLIFVTYKNLSLIYLSQFKLEYLSFRPRK